VSTLKKMPGHTRLHRRGSTYYHRAVVPKDIADTYPKREETFSLGTKDHAEALRLVKIKAVEVDERFEAHRREMAQLRAPMLSELTREQIKSVSDVYYAHLLDEDEDKRLEGVDEFERGPEGLIWQSDWPEPPRDTFEEHQEARAFFETTTRADYARGKVDEFFQGEAEEVLTWAGVSLRLDTQIF
jgi:hypothetical protein